LALAEMLDECKLLYCVLDVKIRTPSFVKVFFFVDLLANQYVNLWENVYRQINGKIFLQLGRVSHTIAVD